MPFGPHSVKQNAIKLTYEVQRINMHHRDITEVTAV